MRIKRIYALIYARHSKFGIPVGGFLRFNVLLGVPRGVLILVSRSWFCSGPCPYLPQKTRIFEKSSDQRINADQDQRINK